MIKIWPESYAGNPSPAYRRAVQALRALGESEGVEMVTPAFAEAAAPLRREQFQRIYRVKRTQGRDWVGRLLGKRYDPIVEGNPSIAKFKFPGGDHESVWVRNGKPFLYVSEPAQIHLDKLREMVRFCDAHGLDVTITGWRSMWFPGANVAVVVRKKETALSTGGGRNGNENPDDV